MNVNLPYIRKTKNRTLLFGQFMNYHMFLRTFTMIIPCWIALVGYVTARVTGADDLYRCPSHLARNLYLRTHGDRCYQFIITQNQSWFGAKAHCAQQGGDLLTIESQTTQEFVEQSLTNVTVGGDRLWIGATDTHKEHHWVWMTGQNVSDGYSNWKEGSPNCFLPEFLCREDCAVLLLEEEYKWHPTFCSVNDFQYGFICQYEMQPESTTTSTTTSPSPSPTTFSPPPPVKQHFVAQETGVAITEPVAKDNLTHSTTEPTPEPTTTSPAITLAPCHPSKEEKLAIEATLAIGFAAGISMSIIAVGMVCLITRHTSWKNFKCYCVHKSCTIAITRKTKLDRTEQNKTCLHPERVKYSAQRTYKTCHL